jgi:hypothetical protein
MFTFHYVMVFISNSYIVTFCTYPIDTVNIIPQTLNYRLFKENFEFENYFRVLEDKDIYTLCKFRTTNHKLPIETDRWNNIDRVNRICTKCDNITIGDEYHYIMECEHFSNFRNRFICLLKL